MENDKYNNDYKENLVFLFEMGFTEYKNNLYLLRQSNNQIDLAVNKLFNK